MNPMTMTRPELVQALRSVAEPSEYHQLILCSTAGLRAALAYYASSKADQEDSREQFGPDNSIF